MDHIKTMIDLLEDNSIKIKESVYYYNDIPVPRVTEIISKMISEESLMYWANSLGFKRLSYRKTLNEAAAIGSRSHDLISKFLTGKIDDTILPDDIPFQAFHLWFDTMRENYNYKILGSEVSISCPYFGGTYDLLIEINGLVYLVDFKTSNHVSYKYFLQLSAYKYILETEHGIHIDGFIILQLDKHTPEYEEYIIHMSNPYQCSFMQQCTQTFLSLVYSYYNIKNTENMYKELWR